MICLLRLWWLILQKWQLWSSKRLHCLLRQTFKWGTTEELTPVLCEFCHFYGFRDRLECQFCAALLNSMSGRNFWWWMFSNTDVSIKNIHNLQKANTVKCLKKWNKRNYWIWMNWCVKVNVMKSKLTTVSWEKCEYDCIF